MGKIWFLFKHRIKLILRFIFAVICGNEKCLVCGQNIFLYPVCKSCLQKHFLSYDKDFFTKRCRICGKTLICEKDLCTDCRENPVIKNIDLLIPLYSYRLWNKELMFMWKSLEIRSLSDMFALIINATLKRLGLEKEYIVPVPPRKGKLQEKGWDQIDELCNLLEYKYGYKVLRLLERRTRVQQKSLDREGRLQQIGKAYFCVPVSVFNRQLELYGGVLPQSVILLDDVCTTGSTLESCAKILKEAGIERITGITLFSVD